MECHALAQLLGKPVAEIRRMPMEEFDMWRAYFELMKPKEEINA